MGEGLNLGAKRATNSEGGVLERLGLLGLAGEHIEKIEHLRQADFSTRTTPAQASTSRQQKLGSPRAEILRWEAGEL